MSNGDGAVSRGRFKGQKITFASTAGSSDTSEVWARIKEVYGVDNSDLTSSRLVDIFVEIARGRNPQ
jgi:hypothetical protein